MMKKLFQAPGVIIIIGVIVLLIGLIQPLRYELAQKNGYEVDAVIVEVKKEHEDDLETGYSSISYTVYADYELDGKEYKHVRIGKYYDVEYCVGQTVKVVVNPKAPNKPIYEGGILAVAGFLTVGVGIVICCAGKKKKAA